MVQELVVRYPRMRPVPGTAPRRAASTLVAGIEHLPVELGA